LAAAAFGAIPTPLASLAIVAFSVIMIGALAVAGIYILRR